jgi:hypothetical protein
MLTPTPDKEEEKLENMWKTALDVSDDDKWMIDAWIEDANGILAFVCLNLLVRLFIILMKSFKTGLLSATIGAFVIEFYKKLSPDSSGQTADLLRQISQQLTNSRNGASITVTAAADPPFSPGAHLIWVNGMWIISLVFSVSSALITSLNQQAVRRYIEMLKDSDPNKANDHARVRLLLFRGIKLYKMPLAILAAPALLHLSILLFVGGLVIIFHTIYEKVAIAVDVAAGVSGLVYLAMSLLPLLDLKCPYRTPITYLLRYLWITLCFFARYCGRLPFAKRLPGCPCLCPCPCACLDSDGPDGAGSEEQHMLPGSSDSLEKAGDEQRRHLTDGFRENVIDDATNPQEHEDSKTITWLFKQLSLGDKNKFLVFAASIPRNRVVDLIKPIKSGKIVLRQPLEVLLRSCTGKTGARDPGEHVRTSALLVCLTTINDIAKAHSIPDLKFVRDKLANISLMRGLRNDRDDSIRITSRSICALVARQIFGKRRLEGADLRWLEEVTEEPSNAILEANDTVRAQMNFKSFVYGLHPNDADHLSTEDARSFKNTLAILLNVRNDNPTIADLQPQLSEAVGRVQQYDHNEGAPDVLGRLQSVFPSLSAPPPIYPEARILRGTPQASLPRETPVIHADWTEASTFPRASPSPSIYPNFYNEATSFPAEARFPRELELEVPFVHPEGPSFPVQLSRPAPYSGRATRSHRETRPSLVTPAPRPTQAPAPSAPPPLRVASPLRVPSEPPPNIIFPPSPVQVPPSPVVPSLPAHLPRRATRRHREAPPSLVTPAPRPTPPPSAPPPHRVPSEPPPNIIFPSSPVPPSPVIPSLSANLPRRATRSSHVTPPVAPSRRTAPPPSSFPSPPTFSSPTTISSPTIISTPPRPPSPPRPRTRRRRPLADPTPTPSAVPPPGVPPTSHIASPPPPHTNRRSYTAYPPYEPI